MPAIAAHVRMEGSVRGRKGDIPVCVPPTLQVKLRLLNKTIEYSPLYTGLDFAVKNKYSFICTIHCAHCINFFRYRKKFQIVFIYGCY